MDEALDDMFDLGIITNAIAAAIFLASVAAASFKYDGKSWWCCAIESHTWSSTSAKAKLANRIGQVVKRKIMDLRGDQRLTASKWKSMLVKLGTSSFLNKTASFCKGKMSTPNFPNTLDQNFNLVPFADGKLFDRLTRQIRDIAPSDYISKLPSCRSPFPSILSSPPGEDDQGPAEPQPRHDNI